MRTQNLLSLVIVSLVSLFAGGGLGYYIAKNPSDTPGDQRHIAIALRATDFQNRLVMIRMLREKGGSSDDIAALEISAIALLQTIDLAESSSSPDASHVLKKAGETLASYRKDFPANEFDPSKRASVAKLLAISGNQPGAPR